MIDSQRPARRHSSNVSRRSIIARRAPTGATARRYAAKLSPAEALIDWQTTATDIASKIRALNSRQPAYC